MQCDESSALLPLSIDGELDALSEAALALHLRDCVACEQRQKALAQLASGIRGTATHHGAPESLRQGIEALLPSARFVEAPSGLKIPRHGAFGRRLFWPSLTVAGLIAMAGMGFVLALMWPNQQRLADEAMANHVRALLADHVIDIASSDQHTVKPWFSAKLDFSPPVRDLADQGFPLVGGRLDYLDGHPVAVLVFHRRQHLIEVFVWPENATIAKTMARSIQGYHVIGSAAAGMMFLAVSDVDAGELQRLNQLLQDQP